MFSETEFYISLYQAGFTSPKSLATFYNTSLDFNNNFKISHVIKIMVF